MADKRELIKEAILEEQAEEQKKSGGTSSSFAITIILVLVAIVIIAILFGVIIYLIATRTRCPSDPCGDCPEVNCTLGGQPYINPDFAIYQNDSGSECHSFSVKNSVDFSVVNNSTSFFTFAFNWVQAEGTTCGKSDDRMITTTYWGPDWTIQVYPGITFYSNGMYVFPGRYMSLFNNISFSIAEFGNYDKLIPIQFQNSSSRQKSINLSVDDPGTQRLQIVINSDNTATITVVDK